MTTPSYCEEAADFYSEKAKEEKKEAEKKMALSAEQAKCLYDWICRLEEVAGEKKESCAPDTAAYSFWQGKEDAYSVIRYNLEVRMRL